MTTVLNELQRRPSPSLGRSIAVANNKLSQQPLPPLGQSTGIANDNLSQQPLPPPGQTIGIANDNLSHQILPPVGQSITVANDDLSRRDTTTNDSGSLPPISLGRGSEEKTNDNQEKEQIGKKELSIGSIDKSVAPKPGHNPGEVKPKHAFRGRKPGLKKASRRTQLMIGRTHNLALDHSTGRFVT